MPSFTVATAVSSPTRPTANLAPKVADLACCAADPEVADTPVADPACCAADPDVANLPAKAAGRRSRAVVPAPLIRRPSRMSHARPSILRASAELLLLLCNMLSRRSQRKAAARGVGVRDMGCGAATSSVLVPAFPRRIFSTATRCVAGWSRRRPPTSSGCTGLLTRRYTAAPPHLSRGVGRGCRHFHLSSASAGDHLAHALCQTPPISASNLKIWVRLLCPTGKAGCNDGIVLGLSWLVDQVTNSKRIKAMSSKFGYFILSERCGAEEAVTTWLNVGDDDPQPYPRWQMGPLEFHMPTPNVAD
uniref:Uncharacterized protein n=1 Tax=Leersia perrieri TaxID=77586 RepID=A0A0D9UXT6_9ORYZ